MPPIGEMREDEFTAEGQLLTDVGGTLPFKVLSTPGMIGMMERTAALLAQEHLPADSATVGFEVCVRHVGAAGEGARCAARATVREVADERKWRFEVEVVALEDEERTLGTGTHERRVVQRP